MNRYESDKTTLASVHRYPLRLLSRSSGVVSTFMVVLGSVLTAAVILFIDRARYLVTPFVIAGTICLAMFVGATVPLGPKLRRLSREISWLHVLWILSFASALVFRIRDVKAITLNPVDAWALYRITLVSLVGATLFSRFAMRKLHGTSFLIRGATGWLFAFAVVNLASSLWSVQPAWTLYKSFEFLCDVALLAAAVESCRHSANLKSIFDTTWLLVALLLGTVWVGALLWPAAALRKGIGLLGWQIEGVCPAVAANSVGQYAAVLATVCLTRIIITRRNKLFYSSIFGLMVVTLAFAQTRSAVLGFLAAAALVLYLSRHLGLLSLSLLILGAVILNPDTFALTHDYMVRGQATNALASVSGRLPWWEYAWSLYLENPFLGLGAYAAGRFAVLAQVAGSTSSHMHNAWIEVLLGTGLIGLLLLAVAFLRVWATLLRRPPADSESDGILRLLRHEILGVLVILSVRSVFDSGLVWHPTIEFLLAFMIADRISTNDHLRRQQSPRHGPEFISYSRQDADRLG